MLRPCPAVMAPHYRGVCGGQAGITGSTAPGGDDQTRSWKYHTSRWERAVLCHDVISRGSLGSENTGSVPLPASWSQRRTSGESAQR